MSVIEFASWRPYPTEQYSIEWEGYKFSLLRFGCLTTIEQEYYSRINLAAFNDSNLPFDNYKVQLAAALLKLRLKKPNIPDSEVLLLPNGDPLPYPLVEKIYDFFDAEANRRHPDDPKPETPIDTKESDAKEGELKSTPKDQTGETSISNSN